MWSANANSFFILNYLVMHPVARVSIKYRNNLRTQLLYCSKPHYMFRPYGPSSGDNYRNDIQYMLFRRFSFYCNTSIIFMAMRLIYCFLIYIYTVLRKQYSMKVPPFATKLCVFSLLFILHYLFRPISGPSSGAIWQITKRSSYWVFTESRYYYSSCIYSQIQYKYTMCTRCTFIEYCYITHNRMQNQKIKKYWGSFKYTTFYIRCT
jgi:hypothetical protein